MFEKLKKIAIKEPIATISIGIIISCILFLYKVGPILSFLAKNYFLKSFYKPPNLLPSSYILNTVNKR